MNNEKLATALSALGITKVALDADQRAAMAKATNEPIPSAQGYQGMAGRGGGGIASQVAANDAARAAQPVSSYQDTPFDPIKAQAAQGRARRLREIESRRKAQEAQVRARMAPPEGSVPANAVATPRLTAAQHGARADAGVARIAPAPAAAPAGAVAKAAPGIRGFNATADNLRAASRFMGTAPSASAPAASKAIQALSRGGGKWGRLAALAAGAAGAGIGGYKLLNAKNPFDSRPMSQRGGRGSATNVDFVPPMDDEKAAPDASSVPVQPSVEGSDLRARMGGQPLPEVAPAAPQGQPFVDSPVKNPATQFAGTNDRNAVPEQITGQFTGDNGLVATTSTHFNPVSAEQPFDPSQISAADKAWFRKDTGTAFNPKSVADINYFMNRRRNNATMGEADAMEKMRARQNAGDNTATRNRLLGR